MKGCRASACVRRLACRAAAAGCTRGRLLARTPESAHGWHAQSRARFFSDNTREISERSREISARSHFAVDHCGVENPHEGPLALEKAVGSRELNREVDLVLGLTDFVELVKHLRVDRYSPAVDLETLRAATRCNVVSRAKGEISRAGVWCGVGKCVRRVWACVRWPERTK